MSDNPQDDLINLGVTADASQADTEINQFADLTIEAMDRIIKESQALDDAMTSSINAYNDSITESFKLYDNSHIEDFSAKVTELAEAFKAESAAAEESTAKQSQWQEIFAQSDQRAIGYGNSGGQIGPAEVPDDDSGGGGRGNAYAIARAFSSAGRATGQRGFTDVGAFVYIENAVEKLGASVGTL